VLFLDHFRPTPPENGGCLRCFFAKQFPLELPFSEARAIMTIAGLNKAKRLGRAPKMPGKHQNQSLRLRLEGWKKAGASPRPTPAWLKRQIRKNIPRDLSQRLREKAIET